MAGHPITDWMLKHGIAQWDPDDRRPADPPPQQRPENPPKDGNR